eukprot:3383805-Prymnesium_polylepis.4
MAVSVLIACLIGCTVMRHCKCPHLKCATTDFCVVLDEGYAVNTHARATADEQGAARLSEAVSDGALDELEGCSVHDDCARCMAAQLAACQNDVAAQNRKGSFWSRRAQQPVWAGFIAGCGYLDGAISESELTAVDAKPADEAHTGNMHRRTVFGECKQERASAAANQRIGGFANHGHLRVVAWKSDAQGSSMSMGRGR